MSIPSIIGFCGRAGCGKSTAARHLVSLLPNAHRLSFADPLRQMLQILGLTADDLSDPVLKETPHLRLGGKTPRQALQTLGTEWGRQRISDSLWLDHARRRVHLIHEVGGIPIFDDVRFDNEAAMIKAHGGVVIQIIRPSQEATTPLASSPKPHASEAGLLPGLVSHQIHADDHAGLTHALKHWLYALREN